MTRQTNGTRLNGQPVGGAPKPVRPGDRLEIGGVVLALIDPNHDSSSPSPAHLAIESQHAGLINNVDGVQHFGSRVTHHNNVDINPLPRSRTGRNMIYAGILLKAVGAMLMLYWLSSFWSGIYEDMQQIGNYEPSGPNFPSPVPWVPAAALLFFIGGSLTVAGIVKAYSSRRKPHAYPYQ